MMARQKNELLIFYNSFVSPFKIPLFTSSLLSLLGSGLSATTPLWLKAIVDGLTAGDSARIVVLSAFLFLTQIACAGLSLAAGHRFAKCAQNVIESVRNSVFEKTVRKPVSYFKKQREGELLSVFSNDVSTASSVLTKAPLSFLSSFGFLLFTLVALFAFSPIAAIITISGSLISCAISYRSTPHIKKLSNRYLKQMEDATHALHECYNGITIVKSYGQEENSISSFCQKTSALSSAFLILNDTKLQLSQIQHVISTLTLTLCTTILFLSNNNLPSAGTLIALFNLITSTFSPMRSLVSTALSLQEASAAASRILELTTRDHQFTNRNDHIFPAEEAIFTLEFDKVSHSCTGKNLLRDVSFKLNHGDFVLLKGPSGSGKSTLIDFLVGFSSPTRGEIKVNGTEIMNIDETWMRSEITLIPQDIFLFNGTLRINLLLAKPSASDCELISSIKLAGLTSWYEGLPDGLDTIVGERGCLLSGGERQRLSIARAILKNGSLIVFDESTSWLDQATEEALWARLAPWLKNKITILISHNEINSAPATRILNLENGELREGASSGGAAQHD